MNKYQCPLSLPLVRQKCYNYHMCAKISNISIEKPKKAIGILLYIFSVAAFLDILRYTTGFDIWYDEVFSLSFVKYSFDDIIGLTARDVHPPFYYLYLKDVLHFSVKIFGEESIYTAARIASCLPWFLLVAMSLTYVRKRFGFFTSGLFIFMITCMPQICVYYVEIRMYSLALLLITAHILVADRLLQPHGNIWRRRGLWLLYFLLGIMTAYTQYYACIATIGIYLGTGIALLMRQGENKKADLIGLVCCAAASVLAYLPWLSVLKRQIEHVSGAYWIEPLTLRSIAGCAKFIVLPVVYARNLPMIAAGLLMLTLAVYFSLWFYRSFKEKNSEILKLFMITLFPLVVIVLSGFILSALGTPIFVYRYMVPALGGFWLFFAVAAERLTDCTDKAVVRTLCLILIVPVVFAGGLSMKGFYDEESKKLYEQQHARERVEAIPTGSVIVTNFDHVTGVMGYYRPDCEVYLYEAEIDKLLPDMLESIRDNIGDEAIRHMLDSGKRVYFYGSFNSREDIARDWEEQGIKVTLLDSVLIERYWINVYELH